VSFEYSSDSDGRGLLFLYVESVETGAMDAEQKATFAHQALGAVQDAVVAAFEAQRARQRRYNAARRSEWGLNS